ncbi:hypothetical protein Tco_1396781, partial [Tanacetum coccineum]
QNDYTFDQMTEWAEQEHFEDKEIKEVQRRHLKNHMSMASSANEARKTIVSKLQRELEAEATFANQLLCNLTRYREQMRIREIQMTMMQNMPTTSLNSYGLHALLMTHEADIRTTNNLIRARQELLRRSSRRRGLSGRTNFKLNAADMKKAAYLKSVRDELLRSMEEKRQLIANYREM